MADLRVITGVNAVSNRQPRIGRHHAVIQSSDRNTSTENRKKGKEIRAKNLKIYGKKKIDDDEMEIYPPLFSYIQLRPAIDQG